MRKAVDKRGKKRCKHRSRPGCGRWLDPHFYANRTRSRDELMPWDMISCGVTDDYLWRERERAYASVTTPDRRTHCGGCGANRLVGGKCNV